MATGRSVEINQAAPVALFTGCVMLKTSVIVMFLLAVVGNSAYSQNPKLRTVRLHIDGFSKSKSGAI